jgi:WbqC-like protein family
MIRAFVKKVAIVQSNYIPWKGYFDLIASVDELILYDDMQYTRRDWRNRNQIKTAQGLQWLTVPVKVKGKYHQTIRETEIDGKDWQQTHWKAICQNYRRAQHFDEIFSVFEPFYVQKDYEYLSVLNRDLIEAICFYLGIKTKIKYSWDYQLIEGKTERLVSLCTQAGASEYISGPSAQGYIVPELFESRGIKLNWISYKGYKEYTQLWGEFSHAVTILDLLFNCGKNSLEYMRKINS